MKTNSEHIVTNINQNVFFKEFTFDKNDFYPNDGKKEFADNVLWLDELIFFIQIKERNPKEIKDKLAENTWFENTVLKTAKNQIKKTVRYFNKYPEIKIKNCRDHELDIKQADIGLANKLIIYLPNSNLLSAENSSKKFYESKEVGNIHVFNLEDYYWVCRYLLNPAELNEYLKFRERLYLKHKKETTIYPEQYILSHFLNTDDESIIREEYIDTLSKYDAEINSFNISGILDSFQENLLPGNSYPTFDYYKIIKEIAKLKRYELDEFKTRFLKTIEDVNDERITLPYRFSVPRTGCAFVLVPLPSDKSSFWENALINSIEIYKYKKRFSKCLGVTIFKNSEFYDIQWGYLKEDWNFNQNLENAVATEEEFYKKSMIKPIERYRFKD